MKPSRTPGSSGSDPDDGADGPRGRTIRTAYDLFCQHGVQAIGVDRIVAEAGVAKMTLYRNFRSKEELVVATLERREELWTWGWLGGEVERRGGTPVEKLLAIFDALDEWFRRPDYESCLFISCLLEAHDRTSAIGAASLKGLANIRSLVGRLAGEAGIPDPEGFARRWQVLMSGAIVAAGQGDVDAARRAREVGSLVLEREGVLGPGAG
jgi:AcrR family transcriptional regulator